MNQCGCVLTLWGKTHGSFDLKSPTDPASLRGGVCEEETYLYGWTPQRI